MVIRTMYCAVLKRGPGLLYTSTAAIAEVRHFSRLSFTFFALGIRGSLRNEL
jgi:hypothetical protein